MLRQRQQWTPHNDETLVKMVVDGFDNITIGERINKPPREVCRRILKLTLRGIIAPREAGTRKRKISCAR